jgi:glycosyltransferase involved in cell wall biosynthesis
MSRLPIEVTVTAPVWNEVDSLGPLVERVRTAMEKTGRRWELLLVDDGSTDGSFEEMKRLAASDPRVRYVRFQKNCGQTAAFAAGFREARGEIVVTIDADLQNDPADIPALLAKMSEADVVNGFRIGRQDSPWRLVQSRVANAVRNGFLGDSVRDVGCSLRAMRRSFVLRVPVFRGMHRFLPTLLRWEGARVSEVPVRHHARERGYSKYGMWDRLSASLPDLLAVKWMRSRRVDYVVAERSEP